MNDEDNDTQAELAAWELLQEARRERDEAIRSCYIWQKGHNEIVEERNKLLRRIDVLATDREDWKRLAVEQERDINELQQELATVRKQNNERLTTLRKNNLD